MHTLVLPWITLNSSQEVMRLELLPRSLAVERAGHLGDAVNTATSYFFEHQRQNSLEDERRTDLVPVNPSVILLDAEDELDRARLAMDCLFFGVMFSNTRFQYANGTNFIQFHQAVPESRAALLASIGQCTGDAY